jgi:3-oxoacyl-[acyl-carrier-protein] synthase
MENNKRNVVITAYDVELPYARNVEELGAILDHPKMIFKRNNLSYLTAQFTPSTYQQTTNEVDGEKIEQIGQKLLENYRIEDDTPTLLSFATSISGNIYVENYAQNSISDLEKMNEFSQKLSDFVGTDDVITNISACSAGLISLVLGYRYIKSGRYKRVICLAVDSISITSLTGFDSLGALSQKGCQPLAENRDGITLGEGGCLLVLEDECFARTQGHDIIGQVLGTGIGNDAFHPTKPDPQGSGLIRAMEKTLSEASLSPDEIAYVNLHGTGTQDNDAMEAQALANIYSGTKPIVSSTKGLTGHCLAVTGLLEVIISLQTLKEGKVPGNYNVASKLDDSFEGYVVRPQNQDCQGHIFMSNSAAFGGIAASVAIKLER